MLSHNPFSRFLRILVSTTIYLISKFKVDLDILQCRCEFCFLLIIIFTVSSLFPQFIYIHFQTVNNKVSRLQVVNLLFHTHVTGFLELTRLNPFQPSVTFNIETSHLICSANQMTSFYMKCNIGLKWVQKVMAINKMEWNDWLAPDSSSVN